MSEPIIQLEDVGLSYRLRRGFQRSCYWAVRNLNLAIHPGEIIGLVGHNGAGKSTLLQLVSGILQPETGRLYRQARLKCALLSLQLGFIPYLTGRQNAILGGLLQGLPRRVIEQRLEAILAFSELGEFFDRPINTYSSGMLTRLSFTVAIEINPDVLLIDEVLAVGDGTFQEKSRRALQAKMHARTVLIAAHDLHSLSQICTRIVWMEQGRVCATGPVAETLALYQAHLEQTLATV